MGYTRPSQRGGYTLLELIIASTSGAIIMAGLSGSLYIASQAFDENSTSVTQIAAQQILSDLMADLNQAIRFSERTTNAVTFTVPDRTGDSLPETIRYAWGGVAGDPLTYKYNDSAIVTLASGVQKFDLSYLTRMMTATAQSQSLELGVVFEEFTWLESEHAYGWVRPFTGYNPDYPTHNSAGAQGSAELRICPAVNTTADNRMIL